MMINYAYPDLTSISHGVLFKCECGFVGMTALDILFHQHFNCPKTTCSPWSVIEGQFEAKKKPILIIKANSPLSQNSRNIMRNHFKRGSTIINQSRPRKLSNSHRKRPQSSLQSLQQSNHSLSVKSAYMRSARNVQQHQRNAFMTLPSKESLILSTSQIQRSPQKPSTHC
ncbi:Hypothetical_protein [Hexamita inflata]|uniref:Hypothetical_protein n=1 Tax=Hexamita inflata TaxID=28002 RepID=A0ABP1GIE7_9EUKA